MIKHSTKWGGGGYEAYPQLVHTLDKNKVAKIGARTHKISAKRTPNGIKIKYRYQSTTVQIMLWLLAFCVSAVFAICPLARHATRYNLSATTIKLDTFYINAPAYIAGDTSRGATGAVNGSSIKSDGTLLNTGTIPALFEAGGSVNTTVLKDLLTMINSCSTTANATSGVTYYSAKNFGAYDPTGNAQSGWDANSKGNAQILVKLFETTNNSTNTDLNNFTSQYWQVVYRSVEGERDVLTLYMVRSYKTTQFNPSSTTTYNSEKYYYDANYSQSFLRDKNVIPMYNALNTGNYFATQLNNYVVTPANLPGLWQSSAYQTSRNSSRQLYGTADNGASGSGPDYDEYYLNNGLDGLGKKPTEWESTIESTYADKLWVPSAFEVLHTGYGATADTTLRDQKITYDEDKSIVNLPSFYSAEAAPYDWTSPERTGLWELSAYDRAGSGAWLRSGLEDPDIDNAASSMIATGDEGYNDSSDYEGVMVALNIDLTALRSNIKPELTLNVKIEPENKEGIIYILDKNESLIHAFVMYGGGNY